MTCPCRRAFGVFLEGWATAASGAPANGLADMRRGVELLREQNVLYFDGLSKIALAEAEARAGDFDRSRRDPRRSTGDLLNEPAVARTKRNCTGRAGKSCSNATPPIPRLRKRLSSLPSGAKQQGTRSFGLQAALKLAKLYQSTTARSRRMTSSPPRSKVFRRRREMPEIAEAQALLAALAATEEVKAAAARSVQIEAARRLRQRTYSPRGHGARETTAAFAKARKSASATRMRRGDWLPTTVCGSAATRRGELPEMRAHAAAFLDDLKATPDSPKQASPIAPPELLAGSPANTRKRGITWNERSPCSNPAVTTIWPFALDRTPVSLR